MNIGNDNKFSLPTTKYDRIFMPNRSIHIFLSI